MRARAVLIALALGTVGLAPPAMADDYAVTVSSAPGVIYAACTDHGFNYSVTPPADAEQWSIDLDLQAPDGTAAGSLAVYSTGPTMGVTNLEFCPSAMMAGTYTVTGVYMVLEFHGGLFPDITRTPVPAFTFDVRLAALQATAKASDKTPRRGQSVKVKAKVSDERPGGGFFGTDGAKVQLQRLKGSRWVGVRGARGQTSSSGREVLRFTNTWKDKSTFRVRAKDDSLGTVDSTPFKLRTRR